ncbi:MAG: amidase family protein, partial [Nanoarchaeota archaeon]
MNTFEKLQLLQSGKLTAEQNVKNFLNAIEKDDQHGKKINAFISMNPGIIGDARRIDEKIKKGRAGRLAGMVIGVKSNINVLGLRATCASKVLENYYSSYDASVIKKVKDEDGIIIGMTNMDEFACGSSGETSAFGATKNPADLKRIPGGTSSGSAAAIAAGFCDVSLGSDTGGSSRNPASHCGVVGVKPTYSSVSRYGLIDSSMSLDQVGVLSKDVYGSALLLDVIKGKDDKDAISQDSRKLNLENLNKIQKNITIGILDLKISDKRIGELINKRIKDACEKYGWKTKKIKIDLIDLA